MNTVLDLFKSEKKQWLEDCQATARKLLTHREEITIEDVLAECPRPSYISKNTTGSVFRHPDFRPTGFTKSRRRVSNGRQIMKWTLNEDAFPLIMSQLRRTESVE